MNNAFKVLLAISAGLIAGAAVGLLYAPEEGYETRKRIIKRTKKLVGTVSDSMDDGRESLEEIKEVLQKQLHKVSRKIEELS